MSVVLRILALVLHAACAALAPGRRSLPHCLPTMALADAPEFRIIKGKRVGQDADAMAIARAGKCLEPVDPIAGLFAFGLAAGIASFGFNTPRNREDSIREGGNVPRRRALTWLGLQTGAAFLVGPQLTNPCSNVNSDDRWGRTRSSQ